MCVHVHLLCTLQSTMLAETKSRPANEKRYLGLAAWFLVVLSVFKVCALFGALFRTCCLVIPHLNRGDSWDTGSLLSKVVPPPPKNVILL